MALNPPWYDSNVVMLRNHFTKEQIRQAQIWAARDRSCSDCGAPPFVPCKNKMGIKEYGFDLARENRYPHTTRVDWDKLVKTLIERGYK